MRTCRVCNMPEKVKTKTGPATCPECRRKKYLVVKRRYQQSPKGKSTARAREERKDVKAKRNQFAASPQGIANQKKYRASAKGKANQAKRSANYRSHLSNAEGMVTAEQWIEIVERHKSRCYYCHKKIYNPTMDHVIPLSKGGRNSPENIVPACLSCNCKKRDKLILLC